MLVRYSSIGTATTGYWRSLRLLWLERTRRTSRLGHKSSPCAISVRTRGLQTTIGIGRSWSRSTVIVGTRYWSQVGGRVLGEAGKLQQQQRQHLPVLLSRE